MSDSRLDERNPAAIPTVGLMAAILRNGKQAEGWKIEVSFTKAELADAMAKGRRAFSGPDLESIREPEVVELIVNVKD